MIKAIIFDCFGVLTTEAFDVFRDKYLGEDQPKLEAANKAMDEVNMSLIAYHEFLGRLSKAAGIPTEQVDNELSGNQPNKDLFSYIRTKLKPNYKIGMLSNAGGDWLSELFASQDIKLFDDIILSFKVGLIKPQPEIYNLAAHRLGCKVSQCIFVDDREEYCDGANAVGMQAIRYESFNQFEHDLENILKS